MTPFNQLSLDLSRTVLTAAVAALVVTLIAGPTTIRCLKRRFRERIVTDSARLNELHASKKNTPTMGGLMIIGAVLVGALPHVRFNMAATWLILYVTLALMILGAYDDWIKLKTQRKGLTVRQKFVAQVVIGVIAATWLVLIRESAGANSSSVPSIFERLLSSRWFFILWGTLVIVGSSNAVNLTDGLDGLAAGCTAITGTALTITILRLADASSTTCPEAAIFSAALSGSAIGFLFFNKHPARLFMGDAGSLPIGGLLAIIALCCHVELTLLIAGTVFVVETLSVILQVFWYRRTGQRILLCSPLHNHFVFQGRREPRIVAAFWSAAAMCSVIGVLLAA
jgi:phospho-N-acetylmuramoyl-pentapeptide-transferase